MNIKKSIVTRVRLAFLVIFLFACAIAYRAFSVQFINGERWQKIAQESRITYQPVFATRGNIYSDNESILATSLPFYRVAFDPTIADEKLFNEGIDSLSVLLSGFYDDRSAEYYKRKIKNARLSGRQYVRLNSRLINYQDKKKMHNWPIFRKGKLKGGVIFEKVDKRFKPFGNLAQRTIGFINEDKRGAGLEYSFNHMLAGKDGEALFERMAGGNKPIFDGTEVKPQPGYDIVTTLDINLQDVAENALYKALVSNRAEYGCVVLMEVQTGEIKAIANLGKVGEDAYFEDYNYAVGSHGRTEPGSTFKLASMMALFEDSGVQLTDSIDTGDGRFRFPGATMTDSKIGGYGKLTVQEVFEKSSNIGISRLVNDHFSAKPERFVEYIHQFGLGETLDFQMQGEAKPYIKNPKDRSWSGTTLPWMSIGYELKLSPLQTLTFYNAVANNGVKVQPIIVKEIRKADKVIERYESRILKEKICSDETLRKLKIMLEGVVEEGTGKRVKNENYKVAGKTGTAQKIKNRHYTKTYSTSFVGYFPADNPKYSCIVVIDSPKSFNQYGGDVAAPVFNELASKAFARDLESHKSLNQRLTTEVQSLPVVKAGLQEDLKFICNKLGISTHPVVDEEWVKADSQNMALFWKPNPVLSNQVPDVIGMTLKDALFLLENQGLKVRVIGSGRVRQQSLQPGTFYKKGNLITLKLS